MHLRGRTLHLPNFTQDVMNEYIEEARIAFEESKSDGVGIDKPKTFANDKWIQWEESIYTYLSSIKNTYDIPLSYVIRKDRRTIVGNLDEEQEIIYNASINGPMFTRDSKKVLALLKELTVGTPAETWMKGKKCGREDMMALQSHYDGKTEGERRKAVARADFDSLFYKNETAFPLERYTTKMKEYHNIFEKYGVPMHDEDKVHYFLDKINNPNAELKMEVNICRAHHSATFEDAVTYMSTAVSRIFPNAQPSSGRFKKRTFRQISQAGRGGRGGRGGRDGRGGRPRMENGVDVSDPLPWYTKEEMDKLSYDTRKYILQHPDRPAAIESRKKQRRNNSSATTTNTTNNANGNGASEEQDRLCAAMITGMINAQQNVETVRQQRSQASIQYPVPGSKARAAAASNRSVGVPNQISTDNNGSVASQLRFDAKGNLI